MKNKNSKLEEVGLQGMALKTLLPIEAEILFQPGSLEPAVDYVREVAAGRHIMVRGALNELRSVVELQIEQRMRELEKAIEERDGKVESDKVIVGISQFGSQYGWSGKTTLHELRAVAVDALKVRVQLLDDYFHAQEPEVGTVEYAVKQAGIVSDVINRQRTGWPLAAIYR